MSKCDTIMIIIIMEPRPTPKMGTKDREQEEIRSARYIFGCVCTSNCYMKQHLRYQPTSLGVQFLKDEHSIIL